MTYRKESLCFVTNPHFRGAFLKRQSQLSCESTKVAHMLTDPEEVTDSDAPVKGWGKLLTSRRLSTVDRSFVYQPTRSIGATARARTQSRATQTPGFYNRLQDVCHRSERIRKSRKKSANKSSPATDDNNKDNSHKCNVCGLIFSQKRHLQHHMTVHPDELLHTCEHCGRGFRLKRNLSSHLSVHVGKQPYPCDRCSSVFVSHRSLKTHVQISHGAQDEIKVGSGAKEAFLDQLHKR